MGHPLNLSQLFLKECHNGSNSLVDVLYITVAMVTGQADGSPEDAQMGEVKEEMNETNEERRVALVNKAKEGWKKKSAENVTIGEVRKQTVTMEIDV